MDATTLLVTVYCLVDEWLAGRRLRQRGPTPILADSEVLTIECVGEFLGIDTDKGLYEHFCAPPRAPALSARHYPRSQRAGPSVAHSRPEIVTACVTATATQTFLKQAGKRQWRCGRRPMRHCAAVVPGDMRPVRAVPEATRRPPRVSQRGGAVRRCNGGSTGCACLCRRPGSSLGIRRPARQRRPG
jgi:hypothetical protein